MWKDREGAQVRIPVCLWGLSLYWPQGRDRCCLWTECNCIRVNSFLWGNIFLGEQHKNIRNTCALWEAYSRHCGTPAEGANNRKMTIMPIILTATVAAESYWLTLCAWIYAKPFTCYIKMIKYLQLWSQTPKFISSLWAWLLPAVWPCGSYFLSLRCSFYISNNNSFQLTRLLESKGKWS